MCVKFPKVQNFNKCVKFFRVISLLLFATNIIPAIKSDHSAITLTLNSLDKQPFGPPYWKFNSSLLEDASYIQQISKYPDCLDECKDFNDKRVLWDLIKYRIR